MSRIGSYGASQMYLSRLMAIQQRISNEQIQVSTEKKSVNYTGIASDSNRLINIENEKSRAQSYIEANKIASTRLQAADVSMTAIEDTMKQFRDRLDDFAQNPSTNQQDIEELQSWAYQAMVDMQSYLGSAVDGQYIFSGGRVADQPVDLGFNSLEQFQQTYDGSGVTYPTSRTASLLDIHTDSSQTGAISFDAATGTINAASLTTSPNVLSDLPIGSRITIGDSGGGANDGQSFTVRGITVDATGTHLDVSPLTAEGPVAGTLTYKDATGAEQTVAANLTFSPGADTITSDVSTGLTAGQVFTVKGSSGNDETYEVASITAGPPDTITIKSPKVTTQAASTNISINADSWYKGDTIQIQQRIDDDRIIDLGVYASDPAFEKAFRAMGLIAQGAFGTAGGLDNNMERIDQARFLIKDSISRNGNGVGPFGQEQDGDLEQLQTKVGVSLGMIKTKNEKHQSFSAFLDTRIIGLENVDKTEAVTRLLDDQTALQTSYQALASIRQLSLLNYLK